LDEESGCAQRAVEEKSGGGGQRRSNLASLGTCRFTSVFAVSSSSETSCRFCSGRLGSGTFRRCALAGDLACELGGGLAWVLGGGQTHSTVAGPRCGRDATACRLWRGKGSNAGRRPRVLGGHLCVGAGRRGSSLGGGGVAMGDRQWG
jgi:hypothetical protein